MSDYRLSIAKQIGAGDFDRAFEAALEAGMEDGRRAERARIREILALPEAVGKEAAAAQLAIAGCVSREQARSILSLSSPPPLEPSPSPSNSTFH